MVGGVFHHALVSRFSLYERVAHLLRYTVLCTGLYNAVDKLLVGQLNQYPCGVGVGVAVGKAYRAARIVAVGLEVVSGDIGGVRHVPAFPFKVFERLSRGGLSGHNNGKRAL